MHDRIFSDELTNVLGLIFVEVHGCVMELEVRKLSGVLEVSVLFELSANVVRVVSGTLIVRVVARGQMRMFVLQRRQPFILLNARTSSLVEIQTLDGLQLFRRVFN